MLIEIQYLPTPSGTGERPYAHVERAIAEIQRSGVRYEVGALGTTFEGEPDVVWPLLRRVHEACLGSGADSVLTIIKLAESSAPDETPRIDDLVADYRDD